MYISNDVDDGLWEEIERAKMSRRMKKNFHLRRMEKHLPYFCIYRKLIEKLVRKGMKIPEQVLEKIRNKQRLKESDLISIRRALMRLKAVKKRRAQARKHGRERKEEKSGAEEGFDT